MIVIIGDEITTEIVGSIGRSVGRSDSYSGFVEIQKKNYIIFYEFILKAMTLYE